MSEARNASLIVAVWLWVGVLPLTAFASAGVRQPAPGTIEKGSIRFSYDERGIWGLACPQDPFQAAVTPARALRRPGETAPAGPPVLRLMVRYRTAPGETWTELQTRGPDWDASPQTGTVSYRSAGGPVQTWERFETDGTKLDWVVELRNTGAETVEIGDLAMDLPISGPFGSDPSQIFEHGFLVHRFVSGHGSFLYVVRASGAPPLLLVSVLPGTHLEYWTTRGRQGITVFVHSLATGGGETRGTWRQPHTSLTLPPGSRVSYGLRFQFVGGYEELRRRLYREGLFDVRVVPGMTIPEDLVARVSLHTRSRVESLEAEFPEDTRIQYLGQPIPDHHVYEIAFRRLGENLITIRHDGGRRTYLEFFVTEPLEILIKKRARFIVEKQQIRDPKKWYDGVYGPWDMKAKVVRSVDDPDIFIGRMVYALTCDDPGLSKAPFLAAKNAVFPDRKEIESLEYYVEHFVWGGLQRTEEERPYPYGIYGTPNWWVNRDPERRRQYALSLPEGSRERALRDLAREHVWRSYDYPHVVMLYFHMYQIAKFYPELSKYLDAAGYLQRAWGTAKAFFTYPYEIYPEYYETYKWGLYNELVVLDLIRALEEEGFPHQAAWLRQEWEKKAKYFIYDDPYPYRSEYPFDRTAFESTYALAKYGTTREMKADRNLWYDLKYKKWYSHPLVRHEDARAFMDRQLAAGLAVRGWVNPAYYTLGADPGVSYMAAMGGWGILDYGINFAPEPWDWLQLGYASYLSSWCLMNTGRPETNYGFWFPGPENDGAAGWQFMSAKVGTAWMGSSVPGGVWVPRGPWHYDGEIDLGYGGALRMARTLVTRDPLFGWFAYGGSWVEEEDLLRVVPRDGVRRRLDVVLPDPYLPFPDGLRRLRIELERDGFAAGAEILVGKDLDHISLQLENRTGEVHQTRIRLALPVDPKFDYEVRIDGRPIELAKTGDWDYPWGAEIAVPSSGADVSILRVAPSSGEADRP
ncbi:MAG: DUF5695 domain-containing protein [Acidobacteriota bacterium]